ncbi:MAG: NAD+ synthase [Candidatus Bipolaricaulota bacterium]|nr:NAD+ synthase [Candidatus Bipolaricaulota bacterium]
MMRIAIAQINPIMGDIEHNRRAIELYSARALTDGAELIIFPELSLCGPCPLSLLQRTGFVPRVQKAVQKIAAATKGIGVIIGGIGTGLDGEDGHRLYNSAFLIDGGRTIGEARKLKSQRGSSREWEYFTPGPGVEVFEFRGQKIGINLGDEGLLEDSPIDTQASLGAGLVINITAAPFYRGSPDNMRWLGKKKAKDNGITLIYANLVGGQDGLVYAGGSFVIGPDGKLIFQTPCFKEGLFLVDLEKPTPLFPSEAPIELLRGAITLGIHDYVQKSGFSKVIVGLSGGIDSAVVAALAVDALGSSAVTALFMPSEITSEESSQAARELASRLSIELLELSIDEVVAAYQHSLPHPLSGLTTENLQARTRGTFLMTLANERNALVLAPGNKSEIAVGYNTLYGDTVGALAPIADLYKTEVSRLAGTMGETIPQNIRERPPSAELRPDQRDEDDLPPYPLLDEILHEIIEENSSRNGLIEKGFPKKTVDDVLSRYYRSEYKRRQFPPAIKLSHSDQQLPIAHSYCD